MLLSLGTPPLVTSRLASSVVQALGMVGSGGRFVSPAPQPLVAPPLVEALDERVPLDAPDPLDMADPLDAFTPLVPDDAPVACDPAPLVAFDADDPRFELPPPVVAPAVLPGVAPGALDSSVPFAGALPAPPPHAPMARV
jgi:hypothetical protein